MNATFVYDGGGARVKSTFNGVTTIFVGADTYDLKYDAENRLIEVKKNSVVIASFVYDGDGKQVKSIINGVTTIYVGAHYHVENGVVVKYYFAGATRIAMRRNGALSYLLGDHLGSTSITTDASGNILSNLKYKAWGETRYAYGSIPTNYKYTGQREEAGFGLYFYNARWYDPVSGRFTSADTIVPDGVQGLDRYAYVNNSPLVYTDPSGHDPVCNYSYSDPECKEQIVGPQYSLDFLFPLNRPFWVSGYDYGDVNNKQTNSRHFAVDYRSTDRIIQSPGNGIVVVSDPCDLASCDGILELGREDTNTGYGNMIIIEYPYSSLPESVINAIELQPGESLYLLYAHMSEPPAFEVGDLVMAGEELGTIGNTGYSTGWHLHFAAKVGLSGTLPFGTYDGSTRNNWLLLKTVNPWDIAWSNEREPTYTNNGLMMQ